VAELALDMVELGEPVGDVGLAQAHAAIAHSGHENMLFGPL
jgi:hypothetical protein